MGLEAALLGVGATLLFSIVASKLVNKLGIPVLLLFLAIGMVAGSDGLGGIWFSDAHLAHEIGAVALALILFAGGMDLDWSFSKRYIGPAASLATVGVAVTALAVGFVAWKFLGLGAREGVLLGSIVASTDAAAVFAALNQGSSRLSKNLTSILEMESGSNDPTAIFLTLMLVGTLSGDKTSLWVSALKFVWQMSLGGFGGWLVGRGAVLLMRRLRLDFEGMYHGVSIAVVLIAFGGVALLGGNEFLAVYVAGIAFGNGEFRQKKGLRRFHDGVAWLMQIALFVVLGLLVFPSQLPPVLIPGLVISAVLMFVARPLGTFIALAPFGMKRAEMTLVSWSGLRGAVPIVLATFPWIKGLPRAQEYFHLVFAVVILSALLQGTTIPLLARRLGLLEQRSA